MPYYRVIMVEPEFEESIGFVARAMGNFGIADLRLVNPVAVLGSEGRMRGGHAQGILDSAIIHASLPEALAGVSQVVGTTAQRANSSINLLRRPATPRELAESLAGHEGSVGIVLGREGTGLKNTELGLCDAIVTIPAAESYGTLNISHAAAIIFYELHQTTNWAPMDALATEQVRDTILTYMADSLGKVGVRDYKVALTLRAMRNVLGRSALRRREGSLLAGAMREIFTAMTPRDLEISGPTVERIRPQLEH